MHNKFQILTQTNKLLLFLTYFWRYTSSDSHFIVMMSYDITGGGPMEAPIVKKIYDRHVLITKIIMNKI